MPGSTAPTPAPERLHALDALRAFALLLGVVLHATLSFVPAPRRFWFIQDTQPSMTLALLFFTIHVFRMTTFFVMAGFFAHMSFHRRGWLSFAKDRLQRIALPLLVGWPIVFAAMVLVVMAATRVPNGGPVPGGAPWPPVLPSFPLAHFWFLYVLLELYLAVLLLRAAVCRLDGEGRWHRLLDQALARLMHSPLAPACLALPIGLAFSLDPTWIGWFGIRTPDQSLVTNLQAWIGFGTAFSFGWLLHRQVALLRILEARWLGHSLAAVGLVAASYALTLAPFYVAAGAWSVPLSGETIRLAGAIAYALAIWTTTFAVIGLSLRFMAGFSRARRYLADASYWLYLIHMPLVMALQLAVSQLTWPWPVKFAAILAVALPAMLASYQLLVRPTFIGVVLNGRRIRRPTDVYVLKGDAATAARAEP